MAGKDYWEAGVAQDPDSYWQGTYRKPVGGAREDGETGAIGEESRAEGETPERPRYGSVSARARRAYAAEALRSKDHISAGLLAIFLGMFGIHKFYLGCNQAAFIMLSVSIIGGILTFGLAAAVIQVIAAIEGIIYLTKSQTEFDRIYVLNERDWF